MFTSAGQKLLFKLEKDATKVAFQDVDAPAPSSYETIPSEFPFDSARHNPFFLRYVLQSVRETSREKKFVDFRKRLLQSGLTPDVLDRLSSAFRTSLPETRGEVYATAPIRTQPLRIYTPSEIVSSSEGTHVPLELARAKQLAPEKWKEVKDKLVEFGNKSGLFSNIDVKKIGKSGVDPFQIVVEVNGSKMNLVDVGYGVSQVLPIIYQLQSASDRSAFLIQQPEVHLHPEAQAELGSLFVDFRKSNPKSVLIVETHSDFILDRIKHSISTGAISADDVTIIFFESIAGKTTARNITLDEQGDVIDPPPGYRQFFLEEASRVLGFED